MDAKELLVKLEELLNDGRRDEAEALLDSEMSEEFARGQQSMELVWSGAICAPPKS